MALYFLHTQKKKTFELFKTDHAYVPSTPVLKLALYLTNCYWWLKPNVLYVLASSFRSQVLGSIRKYSVFAISQVKRLVISWFFFINNDYMKEKNNVRDSTHVARHGTYWHRKYICNYIFFCVFPRGTKRWFKRL